MDKNKLINKLIKLLEIPITKLDIFPEYVDIWLNHNKIGSVIFNMETADIPNFTPAINENLRWDLVFECSRNEIGEIIKEIFEEEYDIYETTPIEFGYLLLKKKVNDDNPIRVRAVFDGINWNIYKM